MAHETHHDAHQQETKKISSNFSSSFWFVIIVVGLFVAAVNFVGVMSHDDGGHGAHGEAHEAPAHPVIPTREATSSQTLEGETGMGVIAEDTTQFKSEHSEGALETETVPHESQH